MNSKAGQPQRYPPVSGKARIRVWNIPANLIDPEIAERTFGRIQLFRTVNGRADLEADLLSSAVRNYLHLLVRAIAFDDGVQMETSGTSGPFSLANLNNVIDALPEAHSFDEVSPVTQSEVRQLSDFVSYWIPLLERNISELAKTIEKLQQ